SIGGIVLALGPATGIALGILPWRMRLWHGVELLKQRKEPGEHGLVRLGFFRAERKVIALRQPLQIVTRGDAKCHRCSPLLARGYPVSPWGLGHHQPTGVILPQAPSWRQTGALPLSPSSGAAARWRGAAATGRSDAGAAASGRRLHCGVGRRLAWLRGPHLLSGSRHIATMSCTGARGGRSILVSGIGRGAYSRCHRDAL